MPLTPEILFTAKELRRYTNWTQPECAAMIGISLRRWQYIENGERDTSQLEALAISHTAIMLDKNTRLAARKITLFMLNNPLHRKPKTPPET